MWERAWLGRGRAHVKLTCTLQPCHWIWLEIVEAGIAGSLGRWVVGVAGVGIAGVAGVGSLKNLVYCISERVMVLRHCSYATLEFQAGCAIVEEV